MKKRHPALSGSTTASKQLRKRMVHGERQELDRETKILSEPRLPVHFRVLSITLITIFSSSSPVSSLPSPSSLCRRFRGTYIEIWDFLVKFIQISHACFIICTRSDGDKDFVNGRARGKDPTKALHIFSPCLIRGHSVCPDDNEKLQNTEIQRKERQTNAENAIT